MELPISSLSTMFQVCNMLADGAFECIRNRKSEMHIALNIASRNEHIQENEPYIRTVKKIVRAIENSMT